MPTVYALKKVHAWKGITFTMAPSMFVNIFAGSQQWLYLAPATLFLALYYLTKWIMKNAFRS